jgi:phosphatidylinositol alpha-1,6-mannosyltransferase
VTGESAQGRRRVLLATPDYPPDTGGIQNYLGELVRHLATPVRVVTLAPDSPGLDGAGVGVVRVSRRRWLGRAGLMAHLNVVAILEALRHRPDIFMSGHIVLGPASLMCRLLRIPVVAFVHADEVSEKPRLASWSLRAATIVVAVSGHAAGLARAVGVPARKIRIIHPGVTLPVAEARSGPRSSTVLVVARLVDSYKGHDVLLHAVRLLEDRIPLIRLSVVGDGPLRPALEGLARDLGIEARVTFHGRVSASDLEAMYDSSDVFVMPSRLSRSGGGEGFGIVYLEASAHGLPVIAANEGGAIDAVLDGTTGLLVDPRSAEEVAGAIATVLTEVTLYRALSSGGLDWARAHDWRHLARKYDAVVAEALRR